MYSPSSTIDGLVPRNDQVSSRQLTAVLRRPIHERAFDFHSRVQGVFHTINNPRPTNEYSLFINEHAELIQQGKTSLEIALWLGDSLNITSWKAGAFHGERKVLPTPTSEEMTRLQKFAQTLGVGWSNANGESDNHPDFLLLDGYVQNALFGQENMLRANESLDIFNAEWKNMKYDFVAKTRYLLEKIGLEVKNWHKFTGSRDENGVFILGENLLVSGSFFGNDTEKTWQLFLGVGIYPYPTSRSCLCFLT